MTAHGAPSEKKENTKMNNNKHKKITTTAEVKKISVMTISARAASKKIGAADSRFCVAVHFTDDTRKTAGEHLAAKIADLVKGGDRPEALKVARLTRPFSRRTAAILAARDIAAELGAKLAANIAAEVEAAEEAEKPYIEREAARAAAKAEKAAAKKAEREAAKIAANEDKILAEAAEIQAKREAAARAAA